MRALVVEDDASAWHGVELILRSAQIISDRTDLGEEALDLARRYDYDIILLDLKLPDMPGADVIRRLRAGRIETPVMVLSGSSRPETKAQALRLGADDFLSKPFDRTELLARVQAIVRRCRGFSDTVLRAGSLELNLGSHEVTFNGRGVALTGKEFAILELMVLRKGSIISKEAFLNHLYGGMDVSVVGAAPCDPACRCERYRAWTTPDLANPRLSTLLRLIVGALVVHGSR